MPHLRRGRSPYGERGLKYARLSTWNTGHAGRSPYGERGLKFGISETCSNFEAVALLTESVD